MSTLLKGQSAQAIETAIAAALTALHGSPVEVKVTGLAWPALTGFEQLSPGRKAGTLQITGIEVREVAPPEEPVPF